MDDSVLVYFHCASNTGFAIGRLESVFYRMAKELTGDSKRVHFAYPELRKGFPESLRSVGSIFEMNPGANCPADLESISNAVAQRNIRLAFGFDQQPGLPIYRAFRSAGVKSVISYWGAPMSSLNSGIKLLLKRWQMLIINGPDHYVFESEAMRRAGTNGRGLSHDKTSIVYLGVDCDQFQPAEVRSSYAHTAFNIPADAHIVFYSGHMEPRKGVAVILRAARRIAESGRENIYFVLLGNRPGETEQYDHLYKGSRVEPRVVFGGYRNDIPDLMRSAAIGVIASTGWDSFTRSAVEMAATGLPLVVSRLQGLAETVDEGVTGFTFTPDDDAELAAHIVRLADDPVKRATLGQAARSRVVNNFTEEKQIASLVAICSRTMSA